MNKLGQYHDDDRGHYNLSFNDSDGKHISVSFRAEPDYDLDVVFNEFRNFLIASGHDVQGEVGELGIDEDEPLVEGWTGQYEYQNPTQGKFSMDNLPNNGWPFGGLTTASIAALTTADIAPLTVTNLDTNETYAYKDQYKTKLSEFPTMSPLTSEQFKSLTVPIQDIQSWKFDMPGTAGGSKVKF